jgi:hypothetical protein
MTITKSCQRILLEFRRVPIYAALLSVTFTASLLAQAPAARVTSPDHKLQLQFAIVPASQSTPDTGRLV